MKIRYTEKTVTLGNRAYTVIIPKDVGGFVNKQNILDGDRDSFQALVFGMMELIEHKDNTIVYFPLWKNVPAELMYPWDRSENRSDNFDVVFLSHALQFPLKNWKTLRQKLKKAPGKDHNIDFNFQWAVEKATRIKGNFERTKTYYKDIANFKRYFRFDTHFFVGGVYSFCSFLCDIARFLEQNLEQKYRTSVYVDWTSLPLDYKYDYMEIGLWDRRYEKEHYGNSNQRSFE